jgi:iron complex outermembrane receptor protein
MINYDMTVDGVKNSLAGTHGPSLISGDTGNPKDRAQFTLAWETGPWNITSTTNYVSGMSVTDPSNLSVYGAGSEAFTCADALTNQAGNPAFSNGAPVPDQYCKVKSFTYTNLNVRYQWDKGLTIFGSVTNLFDQKPPMDMGTYAATGTNVNSSNYGVPYNPSLHQAGAVGRAFSLGLNYKF